MATTSTKENQQLMAAASYLLFWFTGLIMLLIEKENTFVRFHAMQSVILFGGIHLSFLPLALIPILGPLVGMALVALSFFLWIMCMWKAFQGETYKVPFVGDLAKQQLAKMK